MNSRQPRYFGIFFVLACISACTSTCATGAKWEDMAPSDVTANYADGSTNIPTNITFTVTFVKAMDANTVTTSSFFLVEGGAETACNPENAIAGDVICASSTECSFTPSSLLNRETTYHVCLTNDIFYEDGNHFPGVSISFTTVGALDVSVTPADGATNVALNTSLQIVFSRDMDASSITDENFSLGWDGNDVDKTVTYNSATKTATITPSALLGNLLTYTATLSSDIKDATGSPLVEDYSWSFTTKAYEAVLRYQKYGEAKDDGLGYSVAGIGDANGDGFDDFIVGTVAAKGAVPEGQWGGGSAYVYSGLDGSLLYPRLDGVQHRGWFGRKVAGLGDVNGDGFDDFIVAANGTDVGEKADAGRVFIYSGASGGELYTIDGDSAGDGMAISATGLGDINGDGKSDFVLGASSTASYRGSVYVHSGADQTSLTRLSKIDGEAASDFFGYHTANIGDMNGDGIPDFIVGANGADPLGKTDAGRIYVFSGTTDGTALFTMDGEAAGDSFGSSVAGLGDVNQDDVPDFVVGAIKADPDGNVDYGSVYVYSGANGNLLYRINGTGPTHIYDRFGSPLACAGDVNGDGVSDFVVGRSWLNFDGRVGVGRVYIYSGLDGSLLYQLDGEAEGDNFGFSVAGAGDVNGDGKLDIVIGARGVDLDAANTDAGAVYVYVSQ